MNIFISGKTGLAEGLKNEFHLHNVICESKSSGCDINQIHIWGHQYINVDMFINCAYDGLGQVIALEYFYNAWKNDKSKCIVNIGSKCITQPRLEIKDDWKFWPYRLHKQFLQMMSDSMSRDAECQIKMINIGSIDTDMIKHISTEKMSVEFVSKKIKDAIDDSTIKRIDLFVINKLKVSC